MFNRFDKDCFYLQCTIKVFFVPFIFGLSYIANVFPFHQCQVLTEFHHRSNQQYVKLFFRADHPLKCKDFLRTTRSRWFQHACCITLWAGQKKNGKRLWFNKISMSRYTTLHIQERQRWIQGVTKGCFDPCQQEDSAAFM